MPHPQKNKKPSQTNLRFLTTKTISHARKAVLMAVASDGKGP
jgi:hypothetical protein